MRVENGEGRLAGQIIDDLHILPTGVEDFQHLVIFAQQVEQRGEINAVGQRINRCSLFLIADLHEAEQRIICVFAHEFCVDAHEIMFSEPLAEIGKFFSFGNKGMNLHINLFCCGRFTDLRTWLCQNLGLRP